METRRWIITENPDGTWSLDKARPNQTLTDRLRMPRTLLGRIIEWVRRHI